MALFHTLPSNLVTTMSDEERRNLGNEPLAILKRVAFLHLHNALFSSDAQMTRAARHRRATAQRAAALYQGANAVP